MRFLVSTTLWVAAIGSGCGFEHGQLENGDDSVDPQPDAGGTIVQPPGTGARTCAYPDQQLKLCLEFNDGVINPIVRDGSSMQLDAQAVGLKATMRTTTPPDPAITMDASASLSIMETPTLDITNAITIEAWIRPSRYLASTIIGNQGQYRLTLNDAGFVGCEMAGKDVHSFSNATSIPPGEWHHVACTFDGSQVRVFVDGSSRDCARDANPMISKTGTNGTKIAPDFTGDIDGVRIYARNLGGTNMLGSTNELCAHANKTNCQRSCDSFGPGPGGDW